MVSETFGPPYERGPKKHGHVYRKMIMFIKDNDHVF